MPKLIFTLFGLICFFGATPRAEVGNSADTHQKFETKGKYVIAVGINTYMEESITSLQYSEKDAKEFIDVLVEKCGYPASQVFPIIGSDATHTKIYEKLQSLSNENLYPDADTIIFYFSGHGTAKDGKNYLIPWDGTINPDLIGGKNLSVERVAEMLKNSMFTRQVVFIDACRNNSITGQKGLSEQGFQKQILDQDDEDQDPDWDQYQNGKGTPGASGLRIFYSAEWGQPSYEDPRIKHGVFSAGLLVGLGGDAADDSGKITVGGLDAFLSRYLGDYSRSEPSMTQFHMVDGQGSSEILLGITGKVIELPCLKLGQAAPQIPMEWRMGFDLAGTFGGNENGFQVSDYNSGEPYILFSKGPESMGIVDVTKAEMISQMDGGFEVGKNTYFAPEADYLVAPMENGDLGFWAYPFNNPLRGFNIESNLVDSFTFSPFGKTLAILAPDDSVFLINSDEPDPSLLPSEGYELDLDSEGIKELKFSTSGKYIYTSQFEGTGMVWEVSGGEQVTQFAGGSFEAKATIEPNEEIIFVDGPENTINAYRLDDGELAYTIQDQVMLLGLDPVGKFASSQHINGEAVVFSIEDGITVTNIPGYARPVHRTVFSQDGGLLVSVEGGSSGKSKCKKKSGQETPGCLMLWDIPSGTSLGVLERGLGCSGIVRFSLNQEYIVTSGSGSGGGGMIHLASLPSGTPIFQLPGHSGMVNSVAISKDGKNLLSGGSDGIVRIWDLETMSLLFTLCGHNTSINMVGFGPAEKSIVSIDHDSVVKIWKPIAQEMY